MEEKHISSVKKTRVNEQITAKEVRLIDPKHEQLGVVNTRQALLMAEEADLDLVEVAPNASPPVCGIMNYGKYLFEQNKKKTAQRKKQKQIHIKTIKLRPNTDVGDYHVKLRKLMGFLEHGDKVKLIVRFRGREMMHQELGKQILQRIETDTKGIAVVEQMAKLEGKQLVMLLGPEKK